MEIISNNEEEIQEIIFGDFLKTAQSHAPFNTRSSIVSDDGTVASSITAYSEKSDPDFDSASHSELLPSRYLRILGDSQTLLVNEQSKLREASGQIVYKFGFGQSPFPPPPEAVAELSRRSAHKEYLPVQGLLELREAVANYHNVYDDLDITAECVAIGAGSKILIYNILRSFTDADVILVTPSWVSYEPQCKLAGLNVIRIQTTAETEWGVTPAMLQNAISGRSNHDKPLLCILNYPGNPNGRTYSVEQLSQLANTFRDNNVLLISDEIYGHLSFSKHTSMQQLYPEGTIVTGGLSKWAGAGGWRLGVALFPKSLTPLLQTVNGISSETFSCAPSPIQYAAIAAYTVCDSIEEYKACVIEILQLAGHFSADSLNAAGVKVLRPQGGFYIYPDFEPFRVELARRGIHTSTELTCDILKCSNVSLLPGEAFGAQPNALTFRLAFVDFNGNAALQAALQHVQRARSLGLKHSSLDDAFLCTYMPKLVSGITSLTAYCNSLQGEQPQLLPVGIIP